MDIRGWPFNKIMQLPDYCFGRRFLVSCTLDIGQADRGWDISEVALPDKCVIWELVVRGIEAYGTIVGVKIALGDQLPTALAQMNALEPLFMGLGLQGPEPRSMVFYEQSNLDFRMLRMPVAAQGRRLVVEGLTGEAIRGSVFVGIVVSSIPTEVPDWLCSGNPNVR